MVYNIRKNRSSDLHVSETKVKLCLPKHNLQVVMKGGEGGQGSLSLHPVTAS